MSKNPHSTKVNIVELLRDLKIEDKYIPQEPQAFEAPSVKYVEPPSQLQVIAPRLNRFGNRSKSTALDPFEQLFQTHDNQPSEAKPTPDKPQE